MVFFALVVLLWTPFSAICGHFFSAGFGQCSLALTIAQKLSYDIRLRKLYCCTVTLKVTYANMKKITRSKSGETTNKATDIYETAAALLDKIEKRPVRLVGISLSSLSTSPNLQMTLFDSGKDDQQDKVGDAMMKLQMKYGRSIVKTASELRAEKRVGEQD